MPVPPFLRQMIRVMRSLVGNIGEKRFAVTMIGINETDEFVGIGFRGIIFLRKFGEIFPVFREKGFRREVP